MRIRVHRSMFGPPRVEIRQILDYLDEMEKEVGDGLDRLTARDAVEAMQEDFISLLRMS